MSDLQQREYYKIFTGSNQEDGYDKIHLGYEAQTSEIIFSKDKNTFFHIPYFASPQIISESTLISDGAIPGPIPAMADRIYKKLGGYGEVSPWGNTIDQHDGTLLCSWLYAVSSETPVWLDRYYNPGRIAYEEVLKGEANFGDYYKSDPIYFDIPSVMVFEPGVQYQYFHQGEKTAQQIVETFSGDDKSHLRLNIEDWTDVKDKSIYNNTIRINNFNKDWVVKISEPGYLDTNSLSFNNTNFIDCQVFYDESYNLTDEFTLSFWMYHDDWANATSTQLVGNLRKSGYGIYYNNLAKNPFFVIPENYYGHLFYCNQNTNIYLDKNIQFILGEPVNPISVCINDLSEVIVLESYNSSLIKYNHKGDVLTLSKNLSGGIMRLEGIPQKMILDENNRSIVLTTSGTYIFNQDLIIENFDSSKPYQNMEELAFDMDGKLHREPFCLDVKFDIYNQKWTIKNDGNLYCQDVYVENLPSNNKTQGFNTNLAVDPENNIWVLAGSDEIYKIDPTYKTVLRKFNIGVSSTVFDKKNIGFIKSYNRDNNSHTWYAILYHNYEKNLYFVTLDGKINKNIFLPEKLNIYDPATTEQNNNVLQFTGSGDFTGYEHRRVLNRKKFKNHVQLNFKIGLKAANRSFPESIHTLSIPVHYFNNKTWYLITAILKNRTMYLYVNNHLRDFKELPGNYKLNYNFEKNFYIGSPPGETENYNKEIATNSIIWNGYLDNIKIYDYAIDFRFIPFFIREKIIGNDINWNIPTAALQYIETIDHFFKHKLPGSKSAFFNIVIKNSSINDSLVKERIERDIRAAIESIKPAYTELLNVKWEN